jgi:hypothetical protein
MRHIIEVDDTGVGPHRRSQIDIVKPFVLKLPEVFLTRLDVDTMLTAIIKGLRHPELQHLCKNRSSHYEARGKALHLLDSEQMKRRLLDSLDPRSFC